jgi:hypothetical protein
MTRVGMRSKLAVTLAVAATALTGAVTTATAAPVSSKVACNEICVYSEKNYTGGAGGELHTNRQRWSNLPSQAEIVGHSVRNMGDAHVLCVYPKVNYKGAPSEVRNGEGIKNITFRSMMAEPPGGLCLTY